MMGRKLLLLGSAIIGTVAYRRFRAERVAAERALAERSRIIDTAFGPIEYAEQGEGAPFLVVHGAGGGYDQGLMLGRDLGGKFRIIAPSRFGYLRTPIPQDFSTAAQADAHLALLDRLGIDRCLVLGASAGAPSALALAMRHPERVRALILMVPRLFHPKQAVTADASVPSRTVLHLLQSASDLAWWLTVRFARSAAVRFLGVDPELEANASPGERERVTELMKSIMPLSKRLPGIHVDGQVLQEDVPVEQLTVPTLIISSDDDLYGTLPPARLAVGRMAGAQLHIFPTGGHLRLGRGEEICDIIAEFLSRADASAELRGAQAADPVKLPTRLANA